ncbi:MAG: hypothetical protein HKN34_03000 [Gammaproteobacteria bacterium]|nr:hypothetical protein [Gammaproteobacteria bacterium]
MSFAKRGGLSLKPGKIGRWNCLRQQLLMPGEKMNVNISGSVRLETLRERDVMRINAELVCFGTPLRWLEADYTDYIKEGPDTVKTIGLTANHAAYDALGLGANEINTASIPTFWIDNCLSVHNNWFKWPEDADITTWPENGSVAVPLSAFWNRARTTATPDDTDDYQVDVSGATMDVRTLAEKQARFRSGMKRDIFAMDDRWLEIMQETYKVDASREVDQVPFMIDKVGIGVNPREMPATDGASLGQWQSMFDFGVNHRLSLPRASEHMVISYFLCIRFAPVIEMRHPLATEYLDWHTFTADPEFLSVAQPKEVNLGDFTIGPAGASIGYLPYGWEWRCGHDVIGKAVDARESFPYMKVPQTAAECKDATNVKDAFRSQALDDYLCDIYFNEDSQQPIGDAMDSYLSGMKEHTRPGVGGSNQEFPKGGKML